MHGPSPDAADLRELAEKYRALAGLRVQRDRTAGPATRATLRALAAFHPGCLREFDTLGLPEIERRARVTLAAAAGAPREPWMAWIWAYHRLMRAALACKRSIGRGSPRSDELPALAARASAITGFALEQRFVEAVAVPAQRRLGVVVLQRLAALYEAPAPVIAGALFPSRRPSPYTLEDRPMSSPLLETLWSRGSDAALALEEDGRAPLTHGELRARAAAVAARLLEGAPTGRGLAGAAVAFLAPPSREYVELLLGVMLAGGTAVPLSPLHTAPELAHILATARCQRVLATEELQSRVAGAEPYRSEAGAAPTLALTGLDPALMLFTSGTTGKPKAVVLSHAAVAATCASLHEAWGWRPDDRLLHVLPLHHTHGVIVALLGALWAGASVRFTPFEARRLWGQLDAVTVVMAVPTIYAKLMEAHRSASAEETDAWRASAGRLRLFTSGSAALPAPLLEEFRAATGQTILERYGMTEIGMALSNRLDGPRVPGAVGHPLPGVSVDLVADDGRPCGPGEPGELRVRSTQLFSSYLGDPEATARSFDELGRFRTGDTGTRDGEGVIRLLGRTSTDVLKSGGYKLSALEIEDALREHPAIAEVAVIGLPDEVWGDRVTACVVLRQGQTLTLDELRAWARDRLAPYKTPRELRVLAALPRNAMGKVQKGRLKETPGA